ncbi:MAG: amidohydrolase family protein [Acidimicrobiia bacterium]|nr:amidohydrolase family protein [Acidimicrobiia bacterium]
MDRIVIRRPGVEEVTTLGIADTQWVSDPQTGDDFATDWWAIPGLVDAHCHLAKDVLEPGPGDPGGARARAFAYLERGVFCVVDKGWTDTTVMTLTDVDPTARPDFEAAGEVLTVPGGYFPGFREIDPADIADEVREVAGDAAGWVKLIGDWPRKGRGAVPNFDLDQLRTGVEAAHGAGARVAIHTMAPDVPSMAVEAGVDSIEHGLFLTEEAIGVLGRRGGAWVPTLLQVEKTIVQLGADSSGGRLLSEGRDNIESLLADAIAAGVVVMAGTDFATDLADVVSEGLRLGQAGLSPGDIITMLCDAPRSYMRLTAGFELGEPADAVFFEADPIITPGVLTHPVAVLRHGRLLG